MNIEWKMEIEMTAIDKFYIEDKVVIITGGAGLLGRKHAEAVIEGRGIPVLIDISNKALKEVMESLQHIYPEDRKMDGYIADITKREEMEKVADQILSRYNSHIV